MVHFIDEIGKIFIQFLMFRHFYFSFRMYEFWQSWKILLKNFRKLCKMCWEIFKRIHSFIKFTKKHKVRISRIHHLRNIWKNIKNIMQKWLFTRQTFLNWSRLHKILPKHLTTTGCCTFIIITGSNRWTPIGNRYQSNRSKTPSICSNELLNRCPSSLKMHKKAS